MANGCFLLIDADDATAVRPLWVPNVFLCDLNLCTLALIRSPRLSLPTTHDMARLSTIKNASTQTELDQASKQYLSGLSEGHPPISVRTISAWLDVVTKAHERLQLEASDTFTNDVLNWEESLDDRQRSCYQTAESRFMANQ